MAKFRAFGFLLLAIAAVAVMVIVRPPSSPSLTFGSEISEAIADNAKNDLNTKGAPQQDVVNGWVARDLLHISDMQNDVALRQQAAQSRSQERTGWLTFIGVLAICWLGLTNSSTPPSDPGRGELREPPQSNAAARATGPVNAVDDQPRPFSSDLPGSAMGQTATQPPP